MKGIWNCCLARLISSIIPRLSVSYNSTMCLRGLKLVIPPSPTGSCEAISLHRCVSKAWYDNDCSAAHAEICTLNHLSGLALKEFQERSIYLESWWIVCCCDIVLLETIQCWVFKYSIAFDEAFLLHLIQTCLDFLGHCPNRQRNHLQLSPSIVCTMSKSKKFASWFCFNWGHVIC